MASYLASPVSEHLGRTIEGFLVVIGAPVARTATTRKTAQVYRESEIFEGGDSGRLIRAYRLPEDVFAPSFLASITAKPLCCPHPPVFLNGDNYQLYAKGIITSPRRGGELEDGEQCLLADLIIFDSNLASQVELGITREISLGYRATYVPHRDGYKQTSLACNHAALVFKGRAGAEVAVADEETIMKVDPKLIAEIERLGNLAERLEERPSLARTMLQEADEVSRLTESGVHVSGFAEQLRKQSSAYAEYSDAAERGKAYEEECRAAGEKLGAKFKPACRDSAAPLKQHGR